MPRCCPTQHHAGHVASPCLPELRGTETSKEAGELLADVLASTGIGDEVGSLVRRRASQRDEVLAQSGDVFALIRHQTDARNMPLPLARTPTEANLFMRLHPCACGEVEWEHHTQLVLQTERGRAEQHQGLCLGCGHSREFIFALPDQPLDIKGFGDERPSELIDAGEWLWVVELFARLVIEQGGRRTPPDKAYTFMNAAADAVDEIAKFIPPGTDEVPDDAFPSMLGQHVRQARSGVFVRAVLAELARGYRAGRTTPHDTPLPLDLMRRRPDGIMRNRLLDSLRGRMPRLHTGDESVLFGPDVELEMSALLGPNSGFDLLGTYCVGLIRWYRYRAAPVDRGMADLVETFRLFGAMYDALPRYDFDDDDAPEVPEPIRLILECRDV